MLNIYLCILKFYFCLDNNPIFHFNFFFAFAVVRIAIVIVFFFLLILSVFNLAFFHNSNTKFL